MLKHDKEVLMRNRLREKEWLPYPKRKDLINNSIVMFRENFNRRKRVRNNNVATHFVERINLLALTASYKILGIPFLQLRWRKGIPNILVYEN